jgi:outer membrane protein assembly factor BamB
MMKRTTSILLLMCLIVSFFISSCSQKQNWPQFRGPDVNMVSSMNNLPAEWGNDKNIKWKYKIEGSGWSSPIVWGNKVFIVASIPVKLVSEPMPQNVSTVSEEEERDEPAEPENPPAPGQTPPPPRPPRPPEDTTGFLKDTYRWEVTCLDLNTGKEIWKQVPYEGNPRIKKHSLNGYASETPVTDGKRLYAYFGMTGVFCYDLDGKLLWKSDIGAFKTQNNWGTGSSPVVYKDVLYIQNDNEVNSFLVAIDAATGKEKWRVARNEKTNYSTPFVWKNNLREELVTLGKTARSYDLNSGELLWEMKIGGEQSIPSPVADQNLIYLGNAGGREVKSNLFAIKAGAAGDITPKDSISLNDLIAWTFPNANLGNSSPLLYKGLLYFFGSEGRAFSCVNSASGKLVYKTSIKRLAETWASPWAYNDKICFYDERGVTRTIKAGEQFELLSENLLKDRFWASAAITNNAYIFKGVDNLYCIKN